MSDLLGALTLGQRFEALESARQESKPEDRSILFLKKFNVGRSVVSLAKKKAKTLPAEEWAQFKARLIGRLSKDL